jgi:hypothetical protein
MGTTMQENEFLESLNTMPKFFPESNNHISDFIKKREPKGKQKGHVTTVRLSGDVNSILDLLAHRADCSKGKVIKAILETGIFQLAGEHNLLEGTNKILFDAIVAEENKRLKKLYENKD